MRKGVHAVPDSKRVGIWIRVSTEDQAQGESPEHHERRARAYADAKGWAVIETYHLEGVSGKSVMEHPETQRMLEDIRSGKITALIFSKLARLARNTRELLEFGDIFRDNHADLISLQESIDTSSPAGRLFFTLIAAMAEWEREEIAERIRASIPIRAQMGKNLGGQATFGYQWHGHELAIDPKEGPIRQLIYELFLEHGRRRTVARLLNERGYRTRNGSKFSDTTVLRLLQDPTAKGMRRSNYTSSPSRNKQWTYKSEEEWVWFKCPPIVSEEVWQRCNDMLAEQKTKGKRKSRKAVHLFAGIIACGCGSKMYMPSYSSDRHTRKYVCRSCRVKIPADDLEALFHEQLRRFVSSPEEIAGYLAQAHEGIAEKERLIDALKAERRDVEREREKVYRAYIDGNLPQDAFGRRYGALDERLMQIDEELPAVQGELDGLKVDTIASDEILSEAADLFRSWPTLSEAQKRTLIEAITESIVVGQGEVEIALYGVPTRPFAPSPNPVNGGVYATRPHGFMAATSWKRAGQVTCA